MKKSFFPLILISLFFLMLFQSAATFRGALNGLNLWLFTIIPSLLPYMIISSYMTESGSFQYLSRFLSPVTKHLFHLSDSCGYVILLGFLCGYPIGSKLSADLVKKGEIPAREGQILLAFCNNVSPAFLITYLADQIICLPALRTLLISIMILVPLLFGIFISRLSSWLFPTTGNPSFHYRQQERKEASIDSCIISSFENIFKLGGYIILFSILNEFLRLLLIQTPELQYRICSFLEITSGLTTYTQYSVTNAVRFTECAAFTAFGGICCLAQTHSMIQGSGLSLRIYFVSKLAIAGITFLLCSFLYHMLY